MAKAKTAETKPGPIQRLRTFLSDVKAARSLRELIPGADPFGVLISGR